MVSVGPYLTGRRFTWRGTMHDGSINRGGRRGRKPTELRASQQPPTHLLLDFLPTWPIPLESAYLNSRALVKPGLLLYPRGEREHLPRFSWSILQLQETSLSEAKRKFYETRLGPRAISLACRLCRKMRLLLQLWSLISKNLQYVW